MEEKENGRENEWTTRTTGELVEERDRRRDCEGGRDWQKREECWRGRTGKWKGDRLRAYLDSVKRKNAKPVGIVYSCR